MEAKSPLSPTYRFILPEGFRRELASMEWESLSQFASDLTFRSEHEREETQRLLRELEFTRLILLTHISHAKHRRPDTKMLVKLVRLLGRCESLARSYEIDLSDFALFLTIVIEKMKKERLIVYRPHPHARAHHGEGPQESFLHFKEMVERGGKAQK